MSCVTGGAVAFTPDPLVTAARHSSETNEHYTPSGVVAAARATLERIDLDPASCEFANRVVLADRFHSEYDNGFAQDWHGRVFLNPPGGRSDNQERRVLSKCRETGACGLSAGHAHEGVESSQKKWWFKLAREFAEGRVTSAIFVGFSVEILQTTQVDVPDGLCMPLDFSLCFPSRRVAYDRDIGGKRKSGSSPPHASVIVCLARDDDDETRHRFAVSFAPLGRVVIQ